jgi:hypothetical protein
MCLLSLAPVLFILGGIYAFFAELVTSCGGDEFGPIGYVRDGQPDSLPAAIVLGALLLLGAGVATARMPSRLGRIYLLTTVTYSAGLGLLWALTPAIWGRGICP